MKKLAVLSVLSVASAAACAQSSSSSVTLYGIADAGVTHVTGLKGGSQNSLNSGIMEGSRVGLRGNEDIMPGWRAIFTLEHRMEINNGEIRNRPISGSQLPDRVATASGLGLPTLLQPAVDAVGATIGSTLGVNLPGRFWDRQIYVGLVTPAGAVLMGRQYTPGYELSATFDILGTQSGLAAGQVGAIPSAIDIRVSNALAYRAVFGPVTAVLMASTNKDTSAPSLRAGSIAYKTDSLSVGAAYNTRDNELGEKSLTNVVLGASYEMGVHKVSVLGATVKDDHPTGLSTISDALQAAGQSAVVGALVEGAYVDAFRQDARLFHIGYRYNRFPNTVYLAYNRFHDRLRDADTSSYGMVYSYSLSKRTDLNLVLVHFDNKGLAQAAPGGNGYLGGMTATAGKDSNSLGLGLRHRF